MSIIGQDSLKHDNLNEASYGLQNGLQNYGEDQMYESIDVTGDANNNPDHCDHMEPEVVSNYDNIQHAAKLNSEHNGILPTSCVGQEGEFVSHKKVGMTNNFSEESWDSDGRGNDNTSIACKLSPTIQKIDDHFEIILEEQEIHWNARYISARQSSAISLWIVICYIVIGAIFFDAKTDWTLNESLLFTVYTITTVGYGNYEIPNKPEVQIFIIFYIFLGIAFLTLFVSQVSLVFGFDCKLFLVY